MTVESQEMGAVQRREWFIHDRFGLFIHWGIYALAARHGGNGLAEWIKSGEKMSDAQYQRYFDHFDPDLYDPAAWARMAKRAGMCYAVITTKHHDGFCLWDSQLTDYKATRTPAGRDLLRPWVEAFRTEGLKIGFYHSLIDWHHPEFPVDGFHPQRDDLAFREASQQRDMHKYVEYLHGQVRELLTGYGQIDILWLDFSYLSMDWGWSKGKGSQDWQGQRLVEMVRELQPAILLNDRVGVDPDFYTPEQLQPAQWVQVDGRRVTWEACHTLNGSWGYDRDNLDWKSPELLVRMLIDTVSKGGNLLLNVGPTARGNLMQDRRQSWTPLDAGCVYIVVLSMGRLPATGVLLPIAASLNEAIGCTCISLPGLCRRSTCQGLQVEWSMPNCFMMVLRYICRAMGTMIHSRSPYLFSALMCSCLFWSYFSGRAHGLKENLPL